MRLGFLVLIGLSLLYGQTCAPVSLLPAGQVSGQLDNTSCSLSDGSPYAAYLLVFPQRGQLQATAAVAQPVLSTVPAAPANLALILRDPTGAQIASGAMLAQAVEAGTYTLLVNAASSAIAAGPAPYTLQTGFTAEAGMLCSNFPLLGINQAVSATLGTAGCLFPDATPYDAYTVNTFGSGTLTVSVASTAFTPVVTVRGPGGVALATGAATAAGTVSVPVSASTSYEVIVGTADTSGAYQIATSFQVASTETCLPQKTLTQSATDSNAVTSTSCSLVVDSQGDLAFYTYYNLTVASAGLADIAASSSDFTATLYLLDTAGNLLSLDSGGGGNGNAEIRLQLTPGSYVAEVFSNVEAGGNYALTYTFTPDSPQPCVSLAMNPGDAPIGSLSAASCRTGLGLADLYTITLPAAGTLNLDVTTQAFMGQVAIRDTKDNLITLNQDLEGLGDSHITAVLPAGAYTVAAAAIEGAGAYQLVSTFTANPIPACPAAVAVSIGDGFVVQDLGASGCVGSNGQPMDPFQFTLPADGVVAAVMTSGDFAGDLTLADSAGNLLRHDQSSYAPNDPLIVQFLKAGTYQLLARSATSIAAGGLYQVTVIGTVGPRPVFCGAQPLLALGGTAAGTLSTTSCQYIDGTFADIYPVTLTADTSVDLRLDSAAFDAYLILLDSKGNLLAQDDDSGGGTNSRIVQDLPAGTYYVVAKPFANYYSVGPYTLSLAVYQGQ
jgi:hypothetical protein